ncbi:hypothetical protein ED733_002483 [Metarhizium rileyi]|uniref:Uncharacterized protein n=1 Tax=Metarhizium rileyi (strain RCEF 4871) TaxID=1649241 RepID=A0A5C6G148_METRR|nr:hypothetical protein ED733_002483 [Metarhizium rileyi]
MASRPRTATPDLVIRPRESRRDTSSVLHCCCGIDECVLLRRNCSVLDSVEKDVRTAAQLGQALLARHEAYVADAERERVELNARIDRLEMDKRELEAENESKINQNRDLLEQLEALNNTLTDSDAKIKSLESSLLSSHQAVRFLEASADRAADAERHIAILEDEQVKLLNDIRNTKEDARSHAQRFNQAQRGILDMQDQLDRLEEEARQERQRHAEAMERMERQREIEKQLDTAAGRLKGAAATKSLQQHKDGGKIVGHFVRDLLQDNANLQLGMAELREMLISSNDEIQSLREQLMHHQPVPLDSPSRASTLRAELEPLLEAPAVSQELHIHHHYHVPQKHESRKSKKKRQGLLPGIFTPPSASAPSSPRNSDHWERLTPSPTAPALLCRVSEDITTPTISKTTKAWGGNSQPASEFSSSLPSSPQRQPNRVFDPVFSDSDQPTSPTTSFDPMSPTWQAAHSKRPSVSSTVSFHSLASSLIDSVPDTPVCGPASCPHHPKGTIEEEDEEGKDQDEDEPSLPPLTIPTQTPALKVETATPAEHSSLVEDSICGLDIHTLKSRPSQMTLRPLGSVEAIVTGVVARPTLSKSTAKHSDTTLRDHFAGLQTLRAAASNSNLASQPCSPATPQGKLGRWVGWRPWGGSSPNPNSSPVPPPDNKGIDKNKEKDKDKDKELHRSPGINQPGAIPGFQQYWSSQKRKGAPAQVIAETIDRDALTEVLQE